MRRAGRSGGAQRGGGEAEQRIGSDLERPEIEHRAQGQQCDAGQLPDRRPLGAFGQRHQRNPHRDRRQDQADCRRRQHRKGGELRPLRDRHEEQAVDRDATDEAGVDRCRLVRRAHGADAEREEDRRGERVPEAGEAQRLQVQVIEADLDQHPRCRPEEGDEQCLENRHCVLAAGARGSDHRLSQSRPPYHLVPRRGPPSVG